MMSRVIIDKDDVTLRPKRYTISVCVGCGLLFQSARNDALTCSIACRVRAHRNGTIKECRALAKSLEITAASIRQAKAIDTLRPDLVPRVMAREIDIAGAMPMVNAAFNTLLFRTLQGADLDDGGRE